MLFSFRYLDYFSKSAKDLFIYLFLFIAQGRVTYQCQFEISSIKCQNQFEKIGEITTVQDKQMRQAITERSRLILLNP